MRILPASQRSPVRWKNGGGITAEVDRDPADGNLDQFGWRVSMAEVATAGPFSTFGGVDRKLLVIDGSGLKLLLAGGSSVIVSSGGAAASFPGDVLVDAELLDGPVRDLNVMTRRGEWRSDLRRLRPASGQARLRAAEVTLIVALKPINVRSDGAAALLGPGDAARFDTAAPFTVDWAQGGAEFAIIDLWRVN